MINENKNIGICVITDCGQKAYSLCELCDAQLCKKHLISLEDIVKESKYDIRDIEFFFDEESDGYCDVCWIDHLSEVMEFLEFNKEEHDEFVIERGSEDLLLIAESLYCMFYSKN